MLSFCGNLYNSRDIRKRIWVCVNVCIALVVVQDNGWLHSPLTPGTLPLLATDLNLGSHVFTLETNLIPIIPIIYFPTTNQREMNLFFKDSEINESFSGIGNWVQIQLTRISLWLEQRTGAGCQLQWDHSHITYFALLLASGLGHTCLC